MTQENETIQAIEILLQEYKTKTKSLADISLCFQKDILEHLNQRKLALIKEDIKTLFDNYQSPDCSEAIETINNLIEEFLNPNETILTSPSLTEVPDISFYNTEGSRVDNLRLEDLDAGKIIDNRYELIKEIGKGGMAVVWKARDKIQQEGQMSEEQCYVAIKFINQGYDENIFANVVREANRTQSLRHDNIISILNVGKTAGLLFIVMELLQGQTLKQFIREKVKKSIESPKNQFIIPYQQAIDITRHIAEAIAYAHRSTASKKGILHLDIKPDNIFYNPDNGVIKVLDFGLARYATKEDDDKTVVKGIDGLTKSYASPEALRRYDIDVESNDDNEEILEASIEDDVYSLACVVYELFSGKKPFGLLLAHQAEIEKKTPIKLELNSQQWQALVNGLAFKRHQRTKNVDDFITEFFGEPKILKTEVLNANENKKKIQTIIVSILAGVIVPALGFGLYSFLNKEDNSPSSLEKAPVPVKLQIENIEKKAEPLKEEAIIFAKLGSLKFWENTNISEAKINETIKFYFSVDLPMYLTLIVINSSGTFDILSNRHLETTNKTYTYPEGFDSITLEGPVGTDKFRAFASEHPIEADWIKLTSTQEINADYLNSRFQEKYKTTGDNFVKETINIKVID